MQSGKIRLTKEKETMLLTLYIRALESRSKEPFLRDPMAETAIQHIDYDFEHTKPNYGESLQIVMRAKQLDLWTSDFLFQHPDATVLHLGCGLDSRVYRVDPPSGVLWFDLDYPEVIDLRRQLFPDRSGYTLIASSVIDPGWLDQVPGGGPLWMLAEGLTYYLTENDMRALLNRLTAKFPSGQMAFDAVSRQGFKLANSSASLRATGATFGWWLDEPQELKRLDPRLELVTELRAVDAYGFDRLSFGFKAILRVMNLFPALRRLNRLLRYRWDSPTSP